jgi:hypothetical protein
MSTKKVRKDTVSAKPKEEQEPEPMDSVSWEDHADKVRLAVGKRTALFAHEHKDKIQNANKEEVAVRSYAAGMYDLLTTARGAMGFWTAEQIRLELERRNRLQEPGRGCDCDTGSRGGSGREQTPEEGQRKTGDVVNGVRGGKPLEKRTMQRDPMYA